MVRCLRDTLCPDGMTSSIDSIEDEALEAAWPVADKAGSGAVAYRAWLGSKGRLKSLMARHEDLSA